MQCVLCRRESDDERLFEKHHLVPGKHRRIKVDRKEDCILTCVDCGDQIHLMFDNQELRTELDSLEALQIAMQSFIQWVRKRPIDRKVNMKRKKRKL
jgi:hypothetical protein